MADRNDLVSGGPTRWKWFVALGIALILLAVVAAFNAAAVSSVSTLVIGAAMLAGGALLSVQALMTRDRRGFSSACPPGCWRARAGFWC